MKPHFGGCPRGLTLFLDMDDFLFDFSGDFRRLFGVDCESVTKAEMWRLIREHGTFFKDLSLCPGAAEFYTCVEGLNPILLTACPEEDFENVAAQKRMAVRARLGRNVPMIPTPGSTTKPQYMHAEGDVLIDDYHRNVNRWVLAGGFAIHHTGNFIATQTLLCEYLWPTKAALGMNPARAAALKTTSPVTTTATPTASLLDAATVNLPEEKPFRITPA